METRRPAFYKRTLLIDRDLQLPLMMYAITISASGVVMAAFFSLFSAYATEMGYSMMSRYLILGTGTLASMGIMVFLGFYITNKVAGPLARLRNQMKAIADGADPVALAPREDDLVTSDLFREYNRLIERIPKK